MRKTVIFIIFTAICLIFTGCLPKYGLTLTGFTVPGNNAVVNQPFSLCVFYSECSTDQIIKTFHWKIDEYEKEFVTGGGGLDGLKFSTPGLKKVHVSVEADYKNFITNELDFVVDVKDTPKN